MAISRFNDIIQHLCRALPLRDGAGLTDGQLLEDYISRRDETALGDIVSRHGSMVWGVCCRVLGNCHDAEDAFQATFLVLFRKATSIASRELLANWLYGVARQTALKARSTVANRRARERQMTDMPEPAGTEHELWHDLRPLLDQELSRLPEKYRTVIVLCDLNGKTRKEAARQLGVPEGTIASRLATARTMLAKRLARHGLAVSGVGWATMLSENVAAAALPTFLVSSTIKAATLVAAGQAAGAGVISAQVAALTEGMVKTMLLMKLKTLTTVMLVLGTVTLTGALLEWGRGDVVGQPAATADEKSPATPKADDLSAKQVIDRMAKVYADCKSYSDSGIVQIVFIQANGNRTVERPFTTAFVRPDRLRFEFDERRGEREWDRYIVWRKGEEVQTWWDVKPGVEKPKSLQLALGAATGVSGLSAHTVPALLLPKEVSGGLFTKPAEAKRIENARLNKTDCFRIQGEYGTSVRTLWIDKKTFLLRRIDAQTNFMDFQTEETTTYDPAIDGAITDKMLEFNPPILK